MSKQIAVRLPDHIVEFIDEQIRERHVQSRAMFVHRALERERRRIIAARDAAILSKRPSDEDDFEDLAEYAAKQDIGLE